MDLEFSSWIENLLGILGIHRGLFKKNIQYCSSSVDLKIDN